MQTVKTLVRCVARTLLWIGIGYTIFFSLAATALIVWVGVVVVRPVREVKVLQHHNPEESATMLVLRQERSGENDTLHHRFVPLDSISRHLIQAVLAAEDDGFYQHPGFDIGAIAAAFDRNRDAGKIRFGGSTITQQVAKNFFLSADRTYVRKGKELVYALLLERLLGKDRILELYLNYAQWGVDLFGCEAAAQHYYRKPASRISRSEAVRLAAVLASPQVLTPWHTESTLMQRRTEVIAANLHQRGRLSDSLYGVLTDSREHPSAQEDEDTTDTDASAPSGH